MRDFFRVLAYVRRYRRRLVLGLLFSLLFAIFSGASIAMILPFANVLFERDGAPAPVVEGASGIAPSDPESPLSSLTALRDQSKARLMAFFWRGDRKGALTRVCLFLALVFFLKGIVNYYQAQIMATLEQRIIKDLRDDVYEHMHSLSLSFFHSTRTGLLVSRITHDVNLVRDAISSTFTNVTRNALLILVFAGLVFWASWRLALVSFVVLPALVLLTNEVSKRLRKHSLEIQGKMADMSSVLQETIAGIRIVKAFGMEAFENLRFRAETEGYLRSYLRFKKVSYIASPLTEFIGVVGALFVFWYGGHQVLEGRLLSPDWFMIFLTSMLALIQPIKAMGHANDSFQQGIAASKRIFELLDMKGVVADRADAQPAGGFRDVIRFERVSFAYGDEPILRGIDLTIRRGEMVAIVGPSGAGKSTLADLIPRFYDPVEGKITLDGVDLRDLSVASLRGLLGIVSQETFLWSGTIESNIAYGQRGVPRDEVVRAARAANADRFVGALPNGYETEIGERGVRLSGGERQRLAIARAILKDPPILILDEATSSLDSDSEAEVQLAVGNLVAGRTVIVIAHRLSTVLKADRIVVMEKGRIVQEGRHESLLASEGIYRRFFERQFAPAAAGARRAAPEEAV